MNGNCTLVGKGKRGGRGRGEVEGREGRGEVEKKGRGRGVRSECYRTEKDKGEK